MQYEMHILTMMGSGSVLGVERVPFLAPGTELPYARYTASTATVWGFCFDKARIP